VSWILGCLQIEVFESRILRIKGFHGFGGRFRGGFGGYSQRCDASRLFPGSYHLTFHFYCKKAKNKVWIFILDIFMKIVKHAN
jgi:hypothetical protein